MQNTTPESRIVMTTKRDFSPDVDGGQKSKCKFPHEQVGGFEILWSTLMITACEPILFQSVRKS